MGRYGEIWGDATFPARKRGGHSPRERLAEQRSGQSLDSAQSRVISGNLGRSESTQSLDSAVRTVPSQAGCEEEAAAEEAAAEGGEGAEGAAAEATPRLVDTRPALEAEHGILYSSQHSRGQYSHVLRCLHAQCRVLPPSCRRIHPRRPVALDA